MNLSATIFKYSRFKQGVESSIQSKKPAALLLNTLRKRTQETRDVTGNSIRFHPGPSRCLSAIGGSSRIV